MDPVTLLVLALLILLIVGGWLSIISWAVGGVGVLVLAAVWLAAAYNRLVALRARVQEAWSDIEVQLKRRYNLIPNLVETVKGYAAHERGVFERVTQARAAAMGAHTPAEHGRAEAALTSALRSLFALAENYPQLRAVESFTKLQDELTDTEDKIQAARRFYNGNVRDLNIAVQSFPLNFVAGLFRFATAEFFELEAGEAAAREPVKVDFGKS